VSKVGRVIAEIVVVPLGTNSPSISSYVAEVERTLRKFNLKVRLTPMSTVLEGELDEVLNAAKVAHNCLFEKGVSRVSTNLRIDERRDKELTMDGKIKAVEEKL